MAPIFILYSREKTNTIKTIALSFLNKNLANDHDRAMLPWVQKFNPYDLYSKGASKPDVKELKPYYDDLIAEYFPAQIDW